MKKKYLILRALILFSILLAFSACTAEYMADCGQEVKFSYLRYDSDSQPEERFGTDIDKVNLYIFDANGYFVGEHTDQGKHLAGDYHLPLNLPTGSYYLVAWGNLSNDYTITPLTPGSTRLEQAQLSLKRTPEGLVMRHPSMLYHGALMNLKVKAGEKQTFTISMVRNTPSIRVIAKGLPLESTKAVSPYDCRIEDNNGDYKFDNTPATNTPVTYLPRYNIEEGQLICEFVEMRLFRDGASRLLLTRQPTDGSVPVELFKESLVGLILKNPAVDLEKTHSYEIVIEFGQDMKPLQVTVNGWKVIDQNTGM